MGPRKPCRESFHPRIKVPLVSHIAAGDGDAIMSYAVTLMITSALFVTAETIDLNLCETSMMQFAQNSSPKT